MRALSGQAKRAITAVTIVALLVALVPFVGFAQESSSSTLGVVRMAQELFAQSFNEDAGNEGLDIAEAGAFLGCEVAIGNASELPPEYLEECFDVSSYENVVVADGGSLVGYTKNGTSENEFSLVAGKLEEQGWTKVESGQANQATFLKNEGVYRWAYVTCSDVDGEVSVVIQCLRESEG